jgi:hypothetical protein
MGFSTERIVHIVLKLLYFEKNPSLLSSRFYFYVVLKIQCQKHLCKPYFLSEVN